MRGDPGHAPRGGRNPFLPAILESGGSAGVPDVEEIHAEATRDVTECLAQVQEEGRSRVVIVCGESGTGKTHLLARLQRLMGGGAFFGWIDPVQDIERIWRHILDRLVATLARPRGTGRPIERLGGWARVEAFLALPESARTPLSLRIEALGSRGTAGAHGPEVASLLSAGVSALVADASPAPEAPDFLHALAGVWPGLLTGDALAAIKAGAPEASGGEAGARRALLHLGAVGARGHPIILAFDQTETLSPGPDTARLDALFRAAAVLGASRGYLVLVTVLEDLWRRRIEPLAAAAGLRPDRTLLLRKLGRREAGALVASRLAPLPEGHPFPERAFDGMDDVSAREVLLHFAGEFERRQQGPTDSPTAVVHSSGPQ